MMVCDICGAPATTANTEQRVYRCGRKQGHVSRIVNYKAEGLGLDIPQDGWIDVEGCKEAARIVCEHRAKIQSLMQLLGEIVEDELAMIQLPHIPKPEYVYCNYCFKKSLLGKPDEHKLYYPKMKHKKNCPWARAKKLLEGNLPS